MLINKLKTEIRAQIFMIMGQEMIVDVTKLNYMYNIPLNGKFNFINPQPKGCYMYMLKQLKWRSHGSLFMCFL